MFRFLGILAILIISVWLGVKISEDPGYALFNYKQWSVEMPLWFAIIALALILFIIYMILRFLDSIDFSIYRWRSWLKRRRKDKAFSKTNRGLLELIEGNWKLSEFYLINGIENGSEPIINYLAAAYAAHEEKAFERRDTYLRKAYAFAPNAEIAIGVMQAKMQIDQGQLEQALATLKNLYNLSPKHKLVLKLLERVYVHLGDWDALLKLLPELKKANIMSVEDAEKLEEKIYQEQLIALSEKSDAVKNITEAWEKFPKKFKRKPNLVFTYVNLISHYPGHENEIEELINNVLKKTWNAPLVKIYGLIKIPEVKKQLLRAEAWHKQYGDKPALLLTLARLCVRIQLWGKAREYLQESLKLEASPEIFIEYGKLLEKLQETDSALQVYRGGLEVIGK